MDMNNNPADIFSNSYLQPTILKKGDNKYIQGVPSFSTSVPQSDKTQIDTLFNAIPDDDEPAEVVSRKDWGAREPTSQGKKVATPVKLLVLKYGTKTPPCESKEECIKTVQEIQRRHMDEMGMKDIGYNFLVSSDGTIYEGRGWSRRTRRYEVKDERYRKLNKRSVDVVFIGDWTETPPLADMMSAVADLCVEGEKKGYLHPDWIVFGPSRLRKAIIHHPVKVKSKREEKYNLEQFEKWFQKRY